MTTHYYARANGTLTIDDDPTPVLQVNAQHPDFGRYTAALTILAELSSAGNHAREWAERAAGINEQWDERALLVLIEEMAEYHRDGRVGA